MRPLPVLAVDEPKVPVEVGELPVLIVPDAAPDPVAALPPLPPLDVNADPALQAPANTVGATATTPKPKKVMTRFILRIVSFLRARTYEIVAPPEGRSPRGA